MTHGANTPPAFEPERLAGGNADDPVLDELGRWFARAPVPRGVEPSGLARVARRLEGAESTRRVPFRTVVVSVALVIAGGGAAAAWGRHRAQARAEQAALASEGAGAAHATRRKPRGVRALHPVPELPSAPPDDGASEAPSATAPNAPDGAETQPDGAGVAPSAAERMGAPNDGVTAPSSRVTASGAPAAPSAAPNDAPGDSELASESSELERALTVLRRDHDAARALSLLERYAAAHPAGVLRLEADVARVDANLALGHAAAALALLERLPLERVGRGLELRLVRAELTAARDCRRANLDFDRVLAAAPPPAFDERALFGRASCREKLGDGAGSRADWALYLARYPSGRFAATARARSE